MTSPAPPIVLPFSAIEPHQSDAVGGKGLALASMFRAGLPVPDGFCLTTHAMALFIEEGGLTERLAAIDVKVASAGLEAQESWAFLGETRDEIARTPIPVAVTEAVREAYEALGRPVVAVRSSGTKEDLEDASFAGQYESYLNVRGADFLDDAIRKCWASIWRNRVLLYSGEKAGGARGLTMGVVVQRLVKATASGVLFTVNPLTGLDDEMLVEATLGLGETLVSGKVNPDAFVLDARTGAVRESRLQEKRVQLRAAASRDTRGESYEGGDAETEEVVDIAERKRAAVTEDELATLAKLGQLAQAHFHRPMDVEWALDGEGISIVQARPITRLTFRPELGEWTNANFKDGGVASDVCVPLMSSLYDRIFSRTMQAWFSQLRLIPADQPIDWLRVLYAKPYWNVGEVKRILLEVPGFIERDFDDDLGMERTYDGTGRVTRLSLGMIIRAIPILFAVRRAYRERLAIAKGYVGPFLERFTAWDAVDLDALERDDLAARYEKLLEEEHLQTESTYFLTVYALSNSKIDFKVAFDKVNKVAGGTLSYLNLIVGLQDVAHLRPYKELHAIVAEAEACGEEPDLTSYIARWGYHSTRELDLRVARWHEDPTFVHDTLAQYRQAAVPDPKAVEAKQRAVYEDERAKLRRVLNGPRMWLRPFLRSSFLKGLARIRAYAWWREEIRDCSTRCYWLVRKYSLALGRRLVAEGALEDPQDLLLLPFPQAIALGKGELSAEAAREEIEWQRYYLCSFERFDNPNEIGAGFRFDPSMALQAKGPRLEGVPGSAGTAVGTARVVTRLEESDKVQPGDVLVTVFTDPGWTPLMSLVSALVTETGGLLSHAAVISREYGIPAVLACSGATQRIKDGDRVEVCGTTGVVMLCDAAADE